MAAPRQAVDRDLPLGVLAVRLEFIAGADLAEAMDVRRVGADRPIGDILADRGTLSPADRALLEPLLHRLDEGEGDDSGRGSGSIGTAERSRMRLAAIGGAAEEGRQPRRFPGRDVPEPRPIEGWPFAPRYRGPRSHRRAPRAGVLRVAGAPGRDPRS